MRVRILGQILILLFTAAVTRQLGARIRRPR